MKNKKSISILITIFLLITLLSMYFTSPTKAEVERYFEEDRCREIKCPGGPYGEVYHMRRQTGMLWGQIFRIPVWWVLPNSMLYTKTPFNYYHEIAHSEDEFHTYTWVDTREGRFVYNAVSGEYVKEIDDQVDPAKKYLEELKDYVEMMKALQENAECSFNAYDCKNFSTQVEAQAVMFYCKSQGNGDIHYLDADNDSKACESLP